ncbi:ATP-binding protein [Microbacterium resistens]
MGRERAVPETVAHALQRVVQEALLNARKHAQAATTRVTLTYFDREVGVDVVDDGIGLEATRSDEPTGGFGIRAMTWRIETLGGELTVESEPGQGTVVAAIVPDASSSATEATP